MNRFYSLLILLSLFFCSCWAEEEWLECGKWIEMTASPLPNYHFDSWSDGSKDSVRLVEITGESVYIAFFAPNCGDYAAVPIKAMYDWLLMLNVNELNRKGYYFSENNVAWYRVVGEVDSIDQPANKQDDELVCHGYYLTIDQNLRGTGDYYAVIDVSTSKAMCTGKMRSVIVHYATPSQRSVSLMPSSAKIGQSVRLCGLDVTEPTCIRVYDAAGRLLSEQQTIGQPHVDLQAATVPGCYCVRVESATVKTSLRYIVSY